MKEKVLVTGASGFIGTNLVRRLLHDGYEVHAFVRDDQAGWRLADIKDKLTFHSVDIGEQDTVKTAVNTIQPEYVFHLATFGGYPAQQDLNAMIKTNISGTLNLLCALESASTLKKVVVAGSSSEYGIKSERMCETDLLEPATPYGVTKSAQTLFTQYFARQKKIHAVVLRLLSVFGPYEEASRLVTDTMRALIKKTPLKLSSPDTRRDFVFVDDVVDAFLKAADSQDCDGEIFNIGSGRETSIKELVERAMQTSGVEIPLEWGGASSRSFDTNHWVADISKAEKTLNWKPKHSLEEGLEQTYKWFQKNVYLYEKA